jgi:ABC-type taurine transport system ATPase subunit
LRHFAGKGTPSGRSSRSQQRRRSTHRGVLWLHAAKVQLHLDLRARLKGGETQRVGLLRQRAAEPGESFLNQIGRQQGLQSGGIQTLASQLLNLHLK